MKRHVVFFLFVLTVSSVAFPNSISLANNRNAPSKTTKAPALQEIVLENAKKTPVVLASSCKSAQLLPLDDFAAFTPLKYGSSGMISKGMWRQSVAWKGCGQERILNVVLYADADKNLLQAMPIAPGNTRSDPLLQKNIHGSAIQLLEYKDKIQGCRSVYVDNTKFLKETKNPKKGIVRPMWEELWTFNVCKKKIQLILTFIPNLKGLPYTMALKGDETAPSP